MRRFNIVEPRSIDDACKILAEDEDAKLISGGTALLILIKHGILLPQTLINLKKIKGATEIAYDPMNGLRVGGLASIYDVEFATWRPSPATWPMPTRSPIRRRR